MLHVFGIVVNCVFFKKISFCQNSVHQNVAHIYHGVESIHKTQIGFFFLFLIFISIFFLFFFCNAFIMKWGFHNEKKIKGNTKTYLQNVCNKSILLSRKLLTNKYGLCSNFKGYLCYKMITPQNVLSGAHVNFFFL